jgi:hypothetical protein
MANEATLIIQTGIPIPFTVADGAGIEKGSVLKMTDPMTAAQTAAVGDIAAGIAAAEKIANDGVTKLAVWREGIFKVTISGNVAVGDPLTTSDSVVANSFEKAATNEEDLWGTALETGTDGQTILMELKPFGISLA